MSKWRKGNAAIGNYLTIDVRERAGLTQRGFDEQWQPIDAGGITCTTVKI